MPTPPTRLRVRIGVCCYFVLTLIWPLPVSATDLLVDDVPIPSDAKIAALRGVPENFGRFSGAWVGAWDGQLRHILIVENVSADGAAKVVYAVGDSPAGNVRRQWHRHDATISAGTLRVESFATYEMSASGKLTANFNGRDGRASATLSKIELGDLLRPGAIIAWTKPVTTLRRVALVIGNTAYRNVARLDNPANDARLLADTLSAIGFALVGGGPQLDLDKASLDRIVQDFGRQLRGADVGLLYYAGHGVQVRGTNYLVPVDANPTNEADLDFQMLDLTVVMRQMESSGTRLNIVMLDACRNNPFGGRGLVTGRGRETESVRFRDTSSGLAQMLAPAGTLISFATQPGSIAQDGIDGHSPYSRALVQTLLKSGLGLFDAFNEIGLEVKRATGGAQQPWVSNSPIEGQFYFVGP